MNDAERALTHRISSPKKGRHQLLSDICRAATGEGAEILNTFHTYNTDFGRRV